jgi:DNA-binding transcriptional LysR family regulator
MDLSLLRTFVAVYRCGSFTAAAPLLGLSQPTVTAQMRALEAQLGRQLFRRQPRGVAPTSVADELAGQVGKHVDALAAVLDRGVGEADPLATPVHLAGPAELTTRLVLPALAELVDRGLRLRVTFGLAEDLLTGLAERRFDLVVSTIRPRARAFVATPLADEEFVLVAGPAWAERLERGQLASDPVAALRGVPMVAYAEDLPIIRRFWRSVFGKKPPKSPATVVPDLRGVLACVLAGYGISVLPRYLCAGELASGELTELVRPAEPPINTLFLTALAGTTQRPHLAAVRDTLLARAAGW